MKIALAAVLLVCASVLGCAALQSQLDAADPADKGHPQVQVPQVIANATTQPAVQATAGVVGAGTGLPWLPIALAGFGVLMSGLATLFRGQASAANAHLKLISAATGIADTTVAVAHAVRTLSPKIDPILKDVALGAGVIASAAPIVGAALPQAASVANDVAQVAGAVQSAASKP